MAEDKEKVEINWKNLDKATSAVQEAFLKLPDVDAKRLQGTFDIGQQVLNAYAEGRQNAIVNAPTGFGKSFLAFYLAEVFKCLEGDAYILTPNKFLQEQYLQDIQKKKLSMVMLQGQNNYTCKENGKKIKERACEDESITDVMNLKTKFTCANQCLYMNLRKSAIESSITVLNNSYWLTTMNYVYKNMPDSAPFKKRSLTVFDEAHSIGSQVQSMFSVGFDINAFIKSGMATAKLYEFALRQSTTLTNVWSYLDLQNAQINLINEYTFHRELQASDFSTVKAAWLQLIEEFTKLNVIFSTMVIDIANDIKTRRPDLQAVGVDSKFFKTYGSDDEQAILKSLSEFNDKLRQLHELDSYFENVGYKSMAVAIGKHKPADVKPIQEFGDASMSTLRFNCADESGIVKLAVIENVDYGLWMSATFGNIDDFAAQTGIDDYVGIDVPQVFDYTRSPITYVTPLISMNHKSKAANMPAMVMRIIDFVNARPNRRGLVHTGNFEIMRALQQQRHPRILCYSNALEKDEMIKILKKRSDVVICGPSLLEGVDLKDDLCRFTIFCKVPYQSLGDELVKRKMMIYDNWYNWFTMSQIEQGLGRGVRNMNDWCETVFLDAGFESFFERYSPPEYVQNRLRMMSINEIIKADPMQQQVDEVQPIDETDYSDDLDEGYHESNVTSKPGVDDVFSIFKQ